MCRTDLSTRTLKDVRESLLEMLRNRLGLTSVKKGCEVGECGVPCGYDIMSIFYMTGVRHSKSRTEIMWKMS